ncbi:hypothetical protein CYMTET_31478 [Cymbomonas tetramitiformis]|uniref:Response regulatory domain-containing protein n=1 Tax=Cymbomonas tetramitiformis TaxID=36881 RepID=A0AAE0FH47_9CHLO|nr:hypothetical protein CYMTET_31478 [Cymbomonas tetramitiformis]
MTTWVCIVLLVLQISSSKAVTKHPYIVALTAHCANDNVASQAIEAGADTIMFKPITIQKISSIVHRNPVAATDC